MHEKQHLIFFPAMISIWGSLILVLNNHLLVSLAAEGSFDLLQDELETDSSFRKLGQLFTLKSAHAQFIILSALNAQGDSSHWIWLRTILMIFLVV